MGRKFNGAVTNRWLYQNQLNPVAELDSAGTVVSRFVYGSRLNVPDYMLKGGSVYRLVTDHLGSVRLVVDTATGTVAQWAKYDEWGVVTVDSGAGFQPFGFAGGIGEPSSSLVRFGARDYDPRTARWTSKEPLGFEGGSAQFYEYSAGDPVNQIDPTGRESDECAKWRAEVARFTELIRNEMRERLRDRRGLFENAYDTPNFLKTGTNTTWTGHKEEIEGYQRGLRRALRNLDRSGCGGPGVPKEVRDLVTAPIPDRPWRARGLGNEPAEFTSSGITPGINLDVDPAAVGAGIGILGVLRGLWGLIEGAAVVVGVGVAG